MLVDSRLVNIYIYNLIHMILASLKKSFFLSEFKSSAKYTAEVF